jgi:hypothetical protein
MNSIQHWDRHNSVSTQTEVGVQFPAEAKILLLSAGVRPVPEHTVSCATGGGVFMQEQSGWNMKLTAHLHLV